MWLSSLSLSRVTANAARQSVKLAPRGCALNSRSTSSLRSSNRSTAARSLIEKAGTMAGPSQEGQSESLPGGCRWLEFEKFSDPRGALTPFESRRHVPFAIERVFVFYDVPVGESRGAHAHRTLEQ